MRVFAGNLRDLLLAAPAGARPTMGLDPGYRTGVKVAVVAGTGQVAATATIYPHEPQRRWDEAIAVLARLAGEHRVELIAIGNGTASRETDRLAAELIRSSSGTRVDQGCCLGGRRLCLLGFGFRLAGIAGARRVLARSGLDREAASGSARLSWSRSSRNRSAWANISTISANNKLARSLNAVVEDCVNAVGVEVNTASTPLLSRVSGIGEGLARGIVEYREGHGPFRTRAGLKKVPRLGPKAFELSAGFLRISQRRRSARCVGRTPGSLSCGAAHSDGDQESSWRTLIGNTSVLRQLEPQSFTDAVFGVPTVTDILRELEKPGRDPRPAFKTASFREGVEKIEDLKPGMVLEGVVTNVAAFGAFVDVGVHQDGLVHISAMANTYVKDPRTVAKPGDVVRVKVLEVDAKRRRISLTMRLDDNNSAPRTTAIPAQPAPARSEKSPRTADTRAGRSNSAPANGDAMAEAFRKARLTSKTPERQ